MKTIKYKVTDLLHSNWLEEQLWTKKELIQIFRNITKDTGASLFDYKDHKEFIDSEKFDLKFIADFWDLKIEPVGIM